MNISDRSARAVELHRCGPLDWHYSAACRRPFWNQIVPPNVTPHMRLFVAVVVAIVVTACGTASGPVVADVEPTTTSRNREVPTTQPDVQPSSSTTLTSTPVVPTRDRAHTIATRFVDELALAASGSELATDMWSGYPYRQEERSTRLRAFVDAYPWLIDNDVEFAVVDAWSFDAATAMTIVAITDVARRGTTSILLDRTGTIQRLQMPDDMSRPLAVSGLVATIKAIPVEGGVVAYLWEEPIDPASITVDHNELSTVIDLSGTGAATGASDLLVVSTATPELPAAYAVLLRVL